MFFTFYQLSLEWVSGLSNLLVYILHKRTKTIKKRKKLKIIFILVKKYPQYICGGRRVSDLIYFSELHRT